MAISTKNIDKSILKLKVYNFLLVGRMKQCYYMLTFIAESMLTISFSV